MSNTDKDQYEVKTSVKEIYDKILNENNKLPLNMNEVYLKDNHFSYLKTFLKNYEIPFYFEVQKPWVLYWVINSIYIHSKEDFNLDVEIRNELSDYILEFQCSNGGFSGTIGAEANIITTYSSILTLAILNLPEKITQINRNKLEKFFMSMKQPDNSFLTHIFGESDLRSTFAVVMCCKLLKLDNNKILDGVSEYVQKCQTYEGGLGPIPSVESHAGFTFCGIATLVLLNDLDKIDIIKITEWLCNRQLDYEGGFSGRTNKLVDSCYTFWVGSCFSLLDENSKEFENVENLIYNQDNLLKYVLFCCQTNSNGYKDKPSKKPDIYHTMYASSGLNICLEKNFNSTIFENVKCSRKMHPIYNIPKNIANDILSINY